MSKFVGFLLLSASAAWSGPSGAADAGAALHRAAGAAPATLAESAPPVPMAAVLVPAVSNLNEGFDNVGGLAAGGWFIQNNSSPLGALGWFQGTPTTATPTPGPFNAWDGAVSAYIAVNFNSTTGGTGTISNWLLTPALDFGANPTLTFYTRKPAIGAGQTDYPDRLEVRYSTTGAGTNIGTGAAAVGDFTSRPLSINENLVVGGYPQAWTQYTVTNLPHNGSGRIAFRYFVTNGGPTGSNSDYIGIDRVVFSAGAPEYRVGGSVSGFAGSGLVLQLNGGNDLPISADGGFQFPAYVTTGGNYSVTVSSQPTATPRRTCTVGNGSGTIGSSDVGNVQVTCTINQYAVGGNVGGLVGSGLVLQLNGGADLPVANDGSFAFAPIDDASNYSITVASQPAQPNQTCAVANGDGSIDGASVTDVAVTCVTRTYAVGGTVAGLAGSGLTLRLNGGSDLAVSANGTFAFPAIDDGSAYSVSVATQPTQLSQTCSVTNGDGTLAGNDVTGVVVACTTHTYQVGGTVAGLTGTGLVLRLNGGTDLPVGGNGAFAFPAIDDGSAYSVAVASQPAQPAQICSVANSAGVLAGADVGDVSVTCADALPQLAVSLADDRGYARYGQTVDYTVTLNNSGQGAATAIALSSVLSPAWDAAQASWTCIDGGNGAVCTPSGSGPLTDTVTLPPGRSLTWLISLPVLAASAEAEAAFEVDADGAPLASDSNILVLLRDGFDVDGGDGTEALPSVLEGAAAAAVLDGEANHVFALSPAAIEGRVERVLVLRAGAREVGVDRYTFAAQQRVRLRVATAQGERIGAWSTVEAGAPLAIASLAVDDGRRVLLEGAAAPLTMPIGR